MKQMKWVDIYMDQVKFKTAALEGKAFATIAILRFLLK